MPDVGDLLEEIVVIRDMWLPMTWLFEGVSCLVVVPEMVN